MTESHYWADLEYQQQFDGIERLDAVLADTAYKRIRTRKEAEEYYRRLGEECNFDDA